VQSLEIKTNQNVTIEYELGQLRDRILAFIIDFLIMVFVTSVLLIIVSAVFPGSDHYYFIYMVEVPIFIFYSLASEIILGGASIGKRALGIRVMRLDGKSNKISDYLIRWAFRGIDIYLSAGSLASILISSSEKKQRIGDVLANTMLVKTRTTRFGKLQEVLGIKSLETYKPVYTQAAKLKEADVLLIKETLIRYDEYKNKSHRESIEMLAETISHIMNVPVPDVRQKEFLMTVMNDFIVLTR
jgi:uncharacterized RDD family membrane protein YckC